MAQVDGSGTADTGSSRNESTPSLKVGISNRKGSNSMSSLGPGLTARAWRRWGREVPPRPMGSPNED